MKYLPNATKARGANQKNSKSTKNELLITFSYEKRIIDQLEQIDMYFSFTYLGSPDILKKSEIIFRENML